MLITLVGTHLAEHVIQIDGEGASRLLLPFTFHSKLFQHTHHRQHSPTYPVPAISTTVFNQQLLPTPRISTLTPSYPSKAWNNDLVVTRRAPEHPLFEQRYVNQTLSVKPSVPHVACQQASSKTVPQAKLVIPFLPARNTSGNVARGIAGIRRPPGGL